MSELDDTIKEIEIKMEELKVLFQGPHTKKNKIIYFLLGLIPARYKQIQKIQKNLLGYSYGLLSCNRDILLVTKSITEGTITTREIKQDNMFG